MFFTVLPSMCFHLGFSIFISNICQMRFVLFLLVPSIGIQDRGFSGFSFLCYVHTCAKVYTLYLTNRNIRASCVVCLQYRRTSAHSILYIPYPQKILGIHPSFKCSLKLEHVWNCIPQFQLGNPESIPCSTSRFLSELCLHSSFSQFHNVHYISSQS